MIQNRAEAWLSYLNMDYKGTYFVMRGSIILYYQALKSKSFKGADLTGYHSLHYLNSGNILKSIIMDSQRVFRSMHFFEIPHILHIIQEVMYIWASTHSESYQQGMLYLLSIVIYTVYHSKSLDFYSDTFMIFDRLMQIEFIHYFRPDPRYLNNKCSRILNYLKAIDIDLFSIISEYNLDINLLIMKWIRCGFIKEFFFDEVLIIWDWLLARKDNNGFTNIEFMALAMIIWTRDTTSGDRFEILQRMAKAEFQGKSRVILILAQQCYAFCIFGSNQNLFLPKLHI